MKRILICGGSKLQYMPVFHYLYENFEFLFPFAEEIIEGGATGADYAADCFANCTRGMKHTKVKEGWLLEPDAGLVFPGSNEISNKLLKLPIPVFFVTGHFPIASPRNYSL